MIRLYPKFWRLDLVWLVGACMDSSLLKRGTVLPLSHSMFCTFDKNVRCCASAISSLPHMVIGGLQMVVVHVAQSTIALSGEMRFWMQMDELSISSKCMTYRTSKTSGIICKLSGVPYTGNKNAVYPQPDRPICAVYMQMQSFCLSFFFRLFSPSQTQVLRVVLRCILAVCCLDVSESTLSTIELSARVVCASFDFNT